MTLRQKLLATTAASTLIAYAFTGMAHANPVDGVVSAGSADITSSGKTLDITQHSDKAIIDWRGFDIGADETTNFIQPNASSLTVNRVNSTSASQINGHLNANGNIVIINQNGIVFGAGATVDVHGLVATTSDSTNDRLLNDTKVHFDLPGNTSASIVNNGTITAHDAGLVGFVAPNVTNNGIITANLGRVHLAAGDKATVDFYGDGLLEVQASDNLQHEIVTQTGQISADGGKIALTAAAGGQVVSSIINAQGVIHAQSVDLHDGEITIGGGNVGAVNVAGTVDASSATGKGGKVTITAKAVTLKNTARVKASGATGGGTIKIGGDAHGTGPTPTAQTVNVERGATIENNAISFGDGGETIVWSDQYTSFEGLISGKGGALGGNGGFTEVSGHDVLHYDGLVDLSANEAYGFEYGALLLDPSDITISAAADSGGSFSSSTYAPTAGTSFISISTLQTQMGLAAVTINTASAQTGNGDITVDGAVSVLSGRTLTLNATRDITITSNGSLIATGSGNSGVQLTAGRDITIGGNVSSLGAGFMDFNAGRNLTVNAGVTLQSASRVINLIAAGGVITNTGVLTMNGVLSLNTNGFKLLSGVDAGGNRVDITINSTNTILQTANISGITITGFNNVNIDRSLPGSGTVTLVAERDLTIASGVTVAAGSGSNMVLKSAGGTITNTGFYTNNGVLSVGTGLTISSGVDGSGNRTDLTLNAGNLSLQNANIGTLSISGFRDVNVATALPGTSTITIAADRDFTNSAVITSGAASAISITANRDIIFGANVNGGTGASSITAQAARNLTLNSGVTLSPGSTGALSLKSASGVATNTGIITLNGVLNLGGGAFTLLSGLNSSANLIDLTLNGTNTTLQGAAIGAVSISGYRDITIARTLPSSGAIAITAGEDLTTSATISSGAASTLTFNAGRDIVFGGDVSGGTGASALSAQAARNLTVNTGVTLTPGTSGAFSLKAAGGLITNTGLLTINGALNAGSNALTLLSGVDGSGNRIDLTLTTANLLSSNTAAVQITGYRDLTINRVMSSSSSFTLNTDRDFINNATITSGNSGALSISAGRNVVLGANVGVSGGGNTFSVLAGGNLTINSGVTFNSGAGGGISLKAAGGVATNVGQFFLNGALSTGTGGITLLSGVDGSGNHLDLTLNATNLILQSATVGTVSLTGFRDITLNEAILSTGIFTISGDRDFINNASMTSASNSSSTFTMGRDIVFAADIIGNGTTSALTIQSGRNLTVNSGVTLKSGSTGALSLKSAGGVIGGTGIITFNGIINASTGGITMQSGLDGSGNRSDLALTTGNTLMQAGSVGAISITGFRDIAINRAITSSAGITVTADRDLTTSAALVSGTAGLALTATNRDITFGADVTAGTGNVAVLAARNVTVNGGVTIKSFSTGGISLRAANGLITNQGLLAINGNLNVGTGVLTLLSGLDASNSRVQDLTLNNTNFVMQGANTGAVSITGFRDITLATSMASNNSFSVTAERNLTVNSGVSLVATINNSITLRAGGGTIVNTGVLTLGGTITIGAGNVALVSGVDGSGNRVDLTINDSTLLLSGASMGALTTSGFRDLTLAKNLTFVGASIVQAERNLTINNGITMTSAASNMTFKAAGGVATNTGVFTNNGVINMGTGSLFLSSGQNSSGVNADITFDTNNLVLSSNIFAGLGLTGFRDVTVSRDLAFSAGATIVALRNLTIGAGVTITTSPTIGLNLFAANNVATNEGVLTMNGIINLGSGALSLTSGVNSSGGRNDIVLSSGNLVFQGATIGGISSTGFRDFTVTRALVGGTYAIQAERNLTVGAITTSATSALTLKAAGGNIANIGLLTLNGPLTLGNSTVYLITGQDPSGVRPDIVLDGNTLVPLNGSSFGALNINGFNDITVAANLTSGSVVFLANRNITVNSGVTLTSTGGINMSAANASTNGLGLLAVNGVLSSGTGLFTLKSGVDSSGNRIDLTLNNSNLIQTGTLNSVTITGYRDIFLSESLSSIGSIAIGAARDLSIASGLSVATGATGALSLTSAGGVTGNQGVLSISGVSLSAGSGAMTLTSGLNSSGAVDADLTLSNANLTMLGANFGATTIAGFRDITVARDMSFSATSIITAARNLTINSGVTLTQSSTGALTLRSAGGIVTNVGLLAMNGIINTGLGSISLSSGVDSSGNRLDIIFDSSNLVLLNGSMSSLVATGYRDISLNETLNTAGISLNAYRNLNVASGVVVSDSLTGFLSLTAANSVTTGLGVLNFNGSLLLGSNARLVLSSGVDNSGNGVDLVLNSANYSQSVAIGAASITGFRDVTLNTGLNSISNITVQSARNLTIGAGVTLTTGAGYGLSLKAANGVIGNVGLLTLNGTLNAGNSVFTLLSGTDSSGGRTNLILDNGHFAQLDTSVSTVSITGFQDITLATNLTSSAGITIVAERNLTINAGATLQAGAAFNMKLAAGGSTALTTQNGILTNNGVVSVGKGLTVQAGADSLAAGSDFVWDNVHYLSQATDVGGLSVYGFRDAIFNTDITVGSGTTLIRPLRDTILAANKVFTVLQGASSFSMYSAGGNTASQYGTIKLFGNVDIQSTTASIAFINGLDSSGNLQDMVWDDGATNHIYTTDHYSSLTLSGYRDITFDADVDTDSIFTATAYRNININGGTTITGSSGHSMTISAAGGNVNAQGVITIDGILNVAGNFVVLSSGLDSSGNRTDIDFGGGHVNLPAHVTDLVAKGYRDITFGTSVDSGLTLTAVAGRNLTIGSGVTLSSGTGMTLVASQSFINNSGANALGGAGRWLVYSQDPNKNVYPAGNGLVHDFALYGCTYGSSCAALPGSGNGFLFASSSMDSVLAGLHANSPLPDSITTFKPTSQPVIVNSPGAGTTASSESVSGTPGVYDSYALSRDYHATSMILTFAPELAERFDLQNWSF